jgi:hypothetical protein
LIISAYYSWELALKVGLDASFDNMWDWEGILEETGEVNSSKVPLFIEKVHAIVS